MTATIGCRFGAYLRGIETPTCCDCCSPYRCSEPTYEGLKLDRDVMHDNPDTCSEPTYEGLKQFVRTWA